MFWSLLRWVLGITAMEERLAGMEERINMLEQVTPPPPPAPARILRTLVPLLGCTPAVA